MGVEPSVDPIPIPISYTIRKICTKCGGTGKVMQAPLAWVDLNGNPVAATEVNCDGCGGTGKIIWGEMVFE